MVCLLDRLENQWSDNTYKHYLEKRLIMKKDIKKVTILKDGKIVEKIKVGYNDIDEFCRKYRENHQGNYTFKIELYAFR